MKKSILILPSIVLLFLVNACTPLPTGGPVSSNVIYKVHNNTMKMVENVSYEYNDSLGIDVNNDNVNDFFVVKDIYTLNFLFIVSNINTEIATYIDSTGKHLKQFSLNESISSTNNWSSYSTRAYNDWIMTTDITGLLVYPIADGACILGLQINNGINLNYGWVKLFLNKLTKEVTIIESAYNTIPNQPILAGKK